MRLEALAIDTTKEVEGVWVKYPGTDIELLTGRAWNPEFDAEFASLARGRAGELTDEEQEEILYLCTVRKCFLGWKNVEGDEGALEYTPALGEELFRKPEYAHLFRFWSAVAMNREHYLATSVELTGKKSATSSNGSSSSGSGKNTSKSGTARTATLAS